MCVRCFVPTSTQFFFTAISTGHVYIVSMLPKNKLRFTLSWYRSEVVRIPWDCSPPLLLRSVCPDYKGSSSKFQLQSGNRWMRLIFYHHIQRQYRASVGMPAVMPFFSSSPFKILKLNLLKRNAIKYC